MSDRLHDCLQPIRRGNVVSAKDAAAHEAAAARSKRRERGFLHANAAPAAIRERKPEGAHHSSRTPAALMTFAHFSVSFAIRAA